MTIDTRCAKSTGRKRKDRLYLRLTTELHWIGQRQNRAQKRQLQAVLSVLPTIKIQVLSLYNADINEAQQTIIFGLSTLRTLVVRSCQFICSTRTPPLSHVTALTLARNDRHTTRRLLTIFASTLETLEVGDFDSTTGSILQGGLIKLPKLSTFAIDHGKDGLDDKILGTFRRYTSIIALRILPQNYLSHMSFHHSDLPALRSLTCDHHLAVSLIPKRPVTTFVEVLSSEGEGLKGIFSALTKTRTGITNLKLFVPDKFCSLLPSLAPYLQYLEQLTLLFCTRATSDHLSGQPHNKPPGAPGTVLPKLKWVTILISGYKKTVSIELLFKEVLIPCPALEVFEYLSFAALSTTFERDRLPEPTQTWKMWRLADGSWERQVPPPIPSPIPAETLHAEP